MPQALRIIIPPTTNQYLNLTKNSSLAAAIAYPDINLENDILEGVMSAQKEFNIRSTPTFIVNGVLYSGNKNIKEFRQIIDKILSQ